MDPVHEETKSDHSQRDWSALASDVLCHISRKLPDLFDFVRFRAVCKSWRSAAPTTNHHPLLPCLFGRKFDQLLLYSLSSGEIHKINFPDPQNAINVRTTRDLKFAGPIEHNILAGSTNSVYLSLINPLTKNEVILPPLNHICFASTWDLVNPTDRSEHVSVIGFEEDLCAKHLALYGHNDGKWVTIRKDLRGRYPIIYYEGMYYCLVYQTRITEVIDATTGEIMSTIPPPDTDIVYSSCNRQHFVESSGNLLLVFGFSKYLSYGDCRIAYSFEIYKLNQENGNLRWVKMSTIGDQALFLDCSRGFSVKATDFDGFKGNCIYWIDSALMPLKDFSVSAISVTCLLRYDIQDGCCTELPYPFNGTVTWIRPSLQ